MRKILDTTQQGGSDCQVVGGKRIEGYYYLAIVPSVMLSFNLQWLNTIRPSTIIAGVDDTWMFSTRLQVVF